MDEHSIERFVDQILDDAERAFGPRVPRALLDRYAHEAALDLWMQRPGTTIAAAEMARNRVEAGRATRGGNEPESTVTRHDVAA